MINCFSAKYDIVSAIGVFVLITVSWLSPITSIYTRHVSLDDGIPRFVLMTVRILPFIHLTHLIAPVEHILTIVNLPLRAPGLSARQSHGSAAARVHRPTAPWRGRCVAGDVDEDQHFLVSRAVNTGFAGTKWISCSCFIPSESGDSCDRHSPRSLRSLHSLVPSLPLFP